jgi:hypothetical protein
MADRADLIIDDVEVIDQPLGGRADLLALSNILAEALVGLSDLPLVALERGAQRIAPPWQHHRVAMVGGKRGGVGVQLRRAQ